MKKITLLLAIVAFVATSCKKDYTCTCSVSSGNLTFSLPATAKSSKKDADSWCAAFQTDYNSNGTTGVVCTVK